MKLSLSLYPWYFVPKFCLQDSIPILKKRNWMEKACDTRRARTCHSSQTLQNTKTSLSEIWINLNLLGLSHQKKKEKEKETKVKLDVNQLSCLLFREAIHNFIFWLGPLLKLLFALAMDKLMQNTQGEIPQCMLFTYDIILIDKSWGRANTRLEVWRRILESKDLQDQNWVHRVKVQWCDSWNGRRSEAWYTNHSQEKKFQVPVVSNPR